jgi:hypothetical protein
MCRERQDAAADQELGPVFARFRGDLRHVAGCPRPASRCRGPARRCLPSMIWITWSIGKTPSFETRFAALLSMKREDAPDVDAAVAAIIADVRARGDAALIELTERFDRLTLTPRRWLFRGPRSTPPSRRSRRPSARRWSWPPAAHPRLSRTPDAQDERWTDETGATLGWRWTPVSAAGLYVPGGLASYPSSVLMNAIPAQVAGVERLVICAPTPDGVVNPLVLLAARLVGGRRRSTASAARRRSRRWPMAPRPSRRSTRSPAPATPMWPRPSGGSSARSAST